jgi:hypothetical protein
MTVKTKTALTPEASAIESNEAAKAALITADEKTNRLSLAVDEYDLGIDAISDSWDQGDETASAADFSLDSLSLASHFASRYTREHQQQLR